MDSREDWRQSVMRAPDDDLLAFHKADYLGLRQDESEHWRVPVVEEELRRRGIRD